MLERQACPHIVKFSGMTIAYHDLCVTAVCEYRTWRCMYGAVLALGTVERFPERGQYQREREHTHTARAHAGKHPENLTRHKDILRSSN